MPTLTLHNQEVGYSIDRARRSSIALSITQTGNIVVKAPILIPDFLIERFIRQKQDWILKKLEHIRLHPPIFSRAFITGELIPYFGTSYPLVVTSSDQIKNPRLYFLKNTFQAIVPVGLSDKQRQQKMIKLLDTWILKNCKPRVEERVAYFAKQMNASYNDVRIRDVTTLWGSCSSKKNLTFNFRLVLMPSEMLDYVIVHELCHLREMNHSSRFWKLVETQMPNYKEIRAEMKKRSIPVE